MVSTMFGALRRAMTVRGPRIRSFGRDRRGVAAVEFALLAIPFFMIVFATLETATVFLAELTLDQAVERIGRQVRTGEVQQGGASRTGMSETEFRTALCKEVSFLMDCSKLKIDLRTYTNYNVPGAPIVNGDLDTTGFGYALPGRKTIAALRVYYKWPLNMDFMRRSFSNMKDGTFLVSSMAAFRTEPF